MLAAAMCLYGALDFRARGRSFRIAIIHASASCCVTCLDGEDDDQSYSVTGNPSQKGRAGTIRYDVARLKPPTIEAANYSRNHRKCSEKPFW
jgi:hypothetical protein